MISGQLSVRPVKIVAGHEPEKTNEFLQAIGTAILNKVRIFFFFFFFWGGGSGGGLLPPKQIKQDFTDLSLRLCFS